MAGKQYTLTKTRSSRQRAYRGVGWTFSQLRALVDFFERALEPLAMGILTQADIRQIVDDAYQQDPAFYDPHMYQPPFASEEAAVARWLVNTGRTRLLDAFCGQGREARMFAANGFAVTGIDREPAMIEGARQFAATADFSATFEVADFLTYAPVEPFEVVYTSAWMYSTCMNGDERKRFLEQCRHLCQTDGYIVISYKEQAAEQSGRYRRHHRIANWIARLSASGNTFEPGDRLYYNLFWHHFTVAQIDADLDAAGLTRVFKHTVSHELVFDILQPTVEVGP